MKKDMGVFSKLTHIIPALIAVQLLVVSCVPSTSKNLRKRVASSSTNGNAISLAVNEGKILPDNPIILSKKSTLSIDADLNQYATKAYITNSAFLEGGIDCHNLQGPMTCFEVKDKKESNAPLQTADGKWGYQTNTDEFLQVNTFYHLNKSFENFLANLSFNLTKAYDAFSTPQYDSAIPLSIYDASKGTFRLQQQTLQAFSNCDQEDNAIYDKSTESLCFGFSGPKKQLRWAHDNTIIYHEAGHFFQKQQLNFRNPPTGPQSQMGNNLFCEAGSIGEGLADFYSYYINGRSHWGEWAAGNLSGSRPMSESEAIHVPGVSTSEDQRLSYPQYLTYDPNFPENPIEDIHMAGMIISHYLVALSKDIQEKCSMPDKDAREFVMLTLNETMAELGDLTTQGTVLGSAGKVNMNQSLSTLWHNVNNPITYRNFSQTMAKNLLNSLGNENLKLCNGSVYTKTNIETLLDSYGLLLFRTYNQHRNLTDNITKTNEKVNPVNRKKSVLITKNNLILDPTAGASTAFVIDNRAQISRGITDLQAAGIIGTISTPSNLEYNNGNSKVSPGEIVAIALNLYNNSNSTMGGIQILANDWDHADTTPGATQGSPCLFGESLSTNQWPLKEEGGIDGGTCQTIGVNDHPTTGDFAPVCFIQSNEVNATKWISQREFRNKIALDQNFCLDKSNDKDCFIRTIKGGDKAHYSKINPKTTWGQTMADPTTGEAYGLDWGNVLLFEVSKHVPPGTVVNCRLRVRFTNCDDCYHDSSTPNKDEYKDKDYNGPKPFNIIQLQIPITD